MDNGTSAFDLSMKHRRSEEGEHCQVPSFAPKSRRGGTINITRQGKPQQHATQYIGFRLMHGSSVLLGMHDIFATEPDRSEGRRLALC